MSIRFRKDRGKYEASVEVAGVRERKLFETRTQAREFEVKMELIARGVIPSFEPTIIVTAISRYHTTVSKGKDAGTFVNERRWLNFASFYFAEINRRFVHEVEQSDLEGLQKWLQEPRRLEWVSKDGETVVEDFKGIKAQTVNRWFSCYRHFFTKCREWKYTPKDPVEFLKTLEEPAVHRERWTWQAVAMVYRAAPAWYRPVFRAIYTYGARPSSLERLTWQQVDFMNRKIIFDSKKGCRAKLKFYPVPMVPPMERALLKLKRSFPLVGPSMAVFRDDRGVAVTADRISKVGARVIAECGLSLDLYALKHTLADQLRMAGVSIDQVGDFFGHADERSTRRYSDNLPVEHMARSLSKVRGGAHQAGGN